MRLSEQKRRITEILLPMCPFVIVDATRPGVEGIPVELQTPDLVLRIGQDPRVLGIPDLVLDESGWRGTLSFRPHHRYVVVPWAAVYALHLGDHSIGPVVAWQRTSQDPADMPTSPGRPSSLKIVK